MLRYTAIIPAAGQGKRMGAGRNKQFLLIGNKPLLTQTIEIFVSDDWCDKIIIVGNEKEFNELQELVETLDHRKPIVLVAGGIERQQSVYQGLKMVEDDTTVVLIHDGARPFVSKQIVHEVVVKAEEEGAATVAVPVKDTIKKAEQHVVTETLDRSSLWAVQTPQAFHLSVIRHAHEVAKRKGSLGTDDASLVEQLGQAVHIIKGTYFNIKITTPEDLILAEAISKSKEITDV
jgi:2-C-methyl-D-erythritol 4-phosphate cytidylyltransferase